MINVSDVRSDSVIVSWNTGEDTVDHLKILTMGDVHLWESPRWIGIRERGVVGKEGGRNEGGRKAVADASCSIYPVHTALHVEFTLLP